MTKVQHSQKKKSCSNCGATYAYHPGSDTVKCTHCGFTEKITNTDKIIEFELKPYLEKLGGQKHTQELSMIQCKSCGANQHISDNYKSLKCAYCSEDLIIEDMKTEEWILPGAILPFQITKNETLKIFGNWINNLWFAPNAVKKAILDVRNTKGLYLPYWTFDAQLYADYTGQRGEYYYVTVPYTTTVNGKTVTQTRREQRTRWYYASGEIRSFVDDTLVKASCESLNKIPLEIARWNLNKLVAFNDDYLAGFVTEKYTIPLKDGHLKSLEKVKQIARALIRRDIGGDTQQISSMDMSLDKETFKHILLPVYISSYKYKSKTYFFYVNGENGIIHGTRPYSVYKIVFLILSILIFAGILMYIYQQNQ